MVYKFFFFSVQFDHFNTILNITDQKFSFKHNKLYKTNANCKNPRSPYVSPMGLPNFTKFANSMAL